MYKSIKLLAILAILYTGALSGQSSDGFSKSITPAISYQSGNFSYTQEFESRFPEQSNFTLEIEEGNEVGIGLLYQIEKNNNHFYRMGIENFSISKSNSFITNDVPLREASNRSSVNTYRLAGHLEYGKYFFPGFSDKFRLALGITASPYTSKYKYTAPNSLSVDYHLFQHGVDLGLSPRISMKLSSLVEIDLTLVAKVINANYSRLNYEDGFLTADERRVRDFELSVKEQSLSAMLGLKFNL